MVAQAARGFPGRHRRRTFRSLPRAWRPSWPHRRPCWALAQRRAWPAAARVAPGSAAPNWRAAGMPASCDTAEAARPQATCAAVPCGRDHAARANRSASRGSERHTAFITRPNLLQSFIILPSRATLPRPLRRRRCWRRNVPLVVSPRPLVLRAASLRRGFMARSRRSVRRPPTRRNLNGLFLTNQPKIHRLGFALRWT